MTKPIPEGFQNLTPHITVKNASKAIELYKKAFGAVEVSRMEMRGHVAHAQLQIGDSMLMMNDEFPEQGAVGPPEQGGGVVLHLYVDDADAWFQRAAKAGLKVAMPLTDMFWGDRYGMLVDPYGHRWSIATHVEDVPPEEIGERAKKAMAPQG